MRIVQSSLVAIALATSFSTAVCRAESDLVEITWQGTTGTQNWQNNANWIGGAFPNDSLKTANLAVPLGANLTVDLGSSTDSTVAGLVLGSSSNGVATNVSGSGTARLVFHNTDEFVTTIGNDADFDNSTTVDGRDFLIWQRGFGSAGDNINNLGDANDDDLVDGADLVIWQEQYGLGVDLFNPGQGFIESKGAAGATNTISANIHARNEKIEIGGTTNLTISGNVTYEGDAMNNNVSSSGIRVMNPGMVVTMTGNLVTANTDVGIEPNSFDFYLNDNPENQGTLILNGQLTGDGRIQVGVDGGNSSLRFPLSTVRLNSANTAFSGGIRQSRGNLELGSNDSLGTGSFTQRGPKEFGYNLIAVGGARTISNEFVLSRSQTFKGSNSFTLAGEYSQSNNDRIMNLLPGTETLTLAGLIDIWEYDEFSEANQRLLTIDGTGKTVISGQVRDVRLDFQGGSVVHGTGIFAVYGMDKTGVGSLTIAMAGSNTNNHSGRTTVRMGNLHYANNGSLNQSTLSESKIFAHNGAVGVDTHPTGQNLGTNSTFLNKISPTSEGGLMLAPTDAATPLNFTTGSLVNAANMSVAAPEGGISYTGTITPANSTYRLGGGVGTLTLAGPAPQLSGANGLEVKNGGKVVLLADNTYTGVTRIQAKYATTGTDQAIADTTQNISDIYYKQIAPVLEVDDLANGGAPSSIGASSNAASNLVIQGSTLRYVGLGDSTNRLFTIGTGGATLDSSGSGALIFNQTGPLAVPDAANQTGSLLSGLSPSNIISAVSNTSDIVVGMTVSDPGPGTPFVCSFTGANCIPAGTTVTGVSADGTQLSLSAGYQASVNKANTQLVFGAVPRDLVLTGSNTAANVLSGTVANSAKGGVVNIIKRGSGTWLLEGESTSTGLTTVEQGILGGNGGVGGNLVVNGTGRFNPGAGVGDFSVAGSFTMNAGAILGIEIASASSFDLLNVTGAAALTGSLNVSLLSFTPAINQLFTVLTAAGGITDTGLTLSGSGGFTKMISGNSLILKYVGGTLSNLASVPEPSALFLASLAALGFIGGTRNTGAR